MTVAIVLMVALGALAVVAGFFNRTLMMIFVTASVFYYIGFTHGYGTGHKAGLSFRGSAAAIQREFQPLTKQLHQQLRKELK